MNRMSKDTIYRQAAIDAVIAEGRNVDSRYLESERIIHESDAVEAISMLPSAPQWIPCSERLPEEDVPVLVTTIGKWGGFVSMDWVDPHTHKWNRSAKAIAWMPLPEPYRKDEEKGEAE